MYWSSFVRPLYFDSNRGIVAASSGAVASGIGGGLARKKLVQARREAAPAQVCRWPLFCIRRGQGGRWVKGSFVPPVQLLL